MKNTKKGFTLVELIIVVVILAILGTIGFISYSKYLVVARDENRNNQLSEIGDGLKSTFILSRLPLPDNSVEIRVNGEVIGYQGYAGTGVLEGIGYSKAGIDPKTKEHFTYYVTKNRKYFELLAYLELDPALSYIGNSDTYAAIDYSYKFPIVYGAKLGILTDEFNTPIQEIPSIKSNGYIDLQIDNKANTYIAHINEGRNYKFTGLILSNKLKTLALVGSYVAPDNCPPGFIGVMGDSEYNQKGFCVSKYEMSYTQSDAPGVPDGPSGNRNVYNYDSTKHISARPDYPIGNITQLQAIEACKSMGKGYHLITNNEWMTIARQIEFEGVNWTSGTPGRVDTYVFPGNTTMASSGRGCKDTEGPNSNGTKTGYSSSETCAKLRQLILFDGVSIWDFAGNIGEHVNKANTVTGSGYNVGRTNIGPYSGDWREMRDIDNGTPNINQYKPLIGEDGQESMGLIYDLDGRNNNVFVRGGNYRDDYNVGIYTLALSKTGGSHYDNYGFRCAKID